MAVEMMSEEAYLRARGWTPRGERKWDPPHRPIEGPTMDIYLAPKPTAEAVETQLAEDRAVLAFVQSRSAKPVPLPDADSLWFEDCDVGNGVVPRLHIGDRGEWYAFLMTPQKALAWAKVLTDFAEGRPVPARPAGEERSPWMPEFYERKEG